MFDGFGIGEWWQPPPRQRRQLTQDDVDGWNDAADKRRSPRSREQIIERIYMANPVRWKRMQRDIKWGKRQMKKMGLNPDEFKDLL